MKMIDLDAVWHDAEEQPKDGENMLVVTTSGDICMCWADAWDNEVIYRELHAEGHSLNDDAISIVSWAYLADLLPTKGGEQ